MIRHSLYIALTGWALLGPAEALIGLPPMVTDSEIAPAKADPLPGESDPPPSRQAERAPTGNPLWAIPLRQLSATRDRPLFSPSRRPPPAAVVNAPIVAPVRAAPKSAEPERPQLALVGTVIGEKDGLGVFVDQATKLAVRLRVGESHQGWTLRSVQPREAILEKERLSAVIALPAPGTPASLLSAANVSPLPRSAQTPTATPASLASKPPQPPAAPPQPFAVPVPTPPVANGAAADSLRQEAAKLFGTLPPFTPASGIPQPFGGRARNR